MADQRSLRRRAMNVMGEVTLLAGLIAAFPGAMLILASTWLLDPRDPRCLDDQGRS